MQQQPYTVTVTDIGWLNSDGDPTQPALTISVEARGTSLPRRLSENTDQLLTAAATDVIFRVQSRDTNSKPTGTLNLSDRITGDILLEAPATGTAIRDLVVATQIYSDQTSAERQYRIRIQRAGEIVASAQKQLLLVYEPDGSLLRTRSLIPRDAEM